MLAALLLALTLSGVALPPENDKFSCVDGHSIRETWASHHHAHGLDRWLNYAEYYEAHLPRPRTNASVKLLEIGVQSGGSARAWRKCYGEGIRYVGVDIDRRCNRSHSPAEGIFIEIGSAMDPKFMQDVCARHGPFDVVIDDGGHTSRMIDQTASVIFPNDSCMASNSVYVVEDLLVMSRCDEKKSYCGKPSEISGAPCIAYESMHDNIFPRTLNKTRTIWSGHIQAIHLYHSIAFYVRGQPPPLQRVRKGRFFTNSEELLNGRVSYRKAAGNASMSAVFQTWTPPSSSLEESGASWIEDEEVSKHTGTTELPPQATPGARRLESIEFRGRGSIARDEHVGRGSRASAWRLAALMQEAHALGYGLVKLPVLQEQP